MPFHPKVLRAKEYTSIPSIIFTFKLAFEFFKECGGVSFFVDVLLNALGVIGL
jgi:hypothetical protein